MCFPTYAHEPNNPNELCWRVCRKRLARTREPAECVGPVCERALSRLMALCVCLCVFVCVRRVHICKAAAKLPQSRARQASQSAPRRKHLACAYPCVRPRRRRFVAASAAACPLNKTVIGAGCWSPAQCQHIPSAAMSVRFVRCQSVRRTSPLSLSSSSSPSPSPSPAHRRGRRSRSRRRLCRAPLVSVGCARVCDVF